MPGVAEIAIVLTAKDMASGVLRKMSGSFGGVFGKIGAAMPIIGGAVAGISALASASLKAFADFEKGMREVNTMMQLQEEDFLAFSQEIRDLAVEMGISAGEMASSLYQAISAGVPKESAIEFLAVASKAAIGGVTDTKTAVDGLTTVINAFGMDISEAQHVADIMFETVKGGKTTMEELSASMYNVAPIAANMGVGFDEVSAALATLTQQGVPTAQATTQLRGALTALIKPTDTMVETIQSLGFESGEAMIASQGLLGAFESLYQSAGGNKEMLGDLFGRVEGLNAVLGLTGTNAEKAVESLENMQSATEGAGASTEAYNEMNKSGVREMAKLKASFQELFLTIGEALMPVLVPLIQSFVKILNALKPLFVLFGKFVKFAIVPMANAISWLIDKALKPLMWIIEQIDKAFGWAKGLIDKFIGGSGGILGVAEAAHEATKELRALDAYTGTAGAIGGGGLTPAPVMAGGATINITVQGSVITERDLAETLRREFIKTKSRNVTTGF